MTVMLSKANNVAVKHHEDRQDQDDEQSGIEHDPEDFRPLTRAEAQALRQRLPQVSPWQVVKVQAVVAGLCVLVASMIGSVPAIGWSALYGAATAVVPQALLAHGMSRGAAGSSPRDAGALAFRFLMWEALKIGLSVAMLAAGSWVVPGLHWPTLLVAMVVSMKSGWLALMFQRPRATQKIDSED